MAPAWTLTNGGNMGMPKGPSSLGHLLHLDTKGQMTDTDAPQEKASDLGPQGGPNVIL